MKTFIYIALGLLVIGLMSMKIKTNSLKDSGKGIDFQEGSFKDALVLAKKENKIVFLDIYASWCGPCKLLKKNTFSDEKVAELYNKKFVNFAVDGEIGEGVTLANKYKITGYPTLLFIKPDGSVHSVTSGYHSPSQFIQLGLKVLSK